MLSSGIWGNREGGLSPQVPGSRQQTAGLQAVEESAAGPSAVWQPSRPQAVMPVEDEAFQLQSGFQRDWRLKSGLSTRWPYRLLPPPQCPLRKGRDRWTQGKEEGVQVWVNPFKRWERTLQKDSAAQRERQSSRQAWERPQHSSMNSEVVVQRPKWREIRVGLESWGPSPKSKWVGGAVLADLLFLKSIPSLKWLPVANILYQETVNLAKPQTSWLQLPCLAKPRD